MTDRDQRKVYPDMMSVKNLRVFRFSGYKSMRTLNDVMSVIRRTRCQRLATCTEHILALRGE